jgi:ABC-type lipoprotein release transport system permease subunit
MLGAAVSLWASKFVVTLIYGMPPRDLSTLVVSTAVLMLVAGCATWVPTRRAMRTDPASILRDM